MATRITQQVVVVGYETSPNARATSVKLEVIRSASAVGGSGSVQPVIIVVASG